MSKIGLVVIHSFLGHAAGKLITDAEEVAKAAEHYPAHFVRRLISDAEVEAAAIEAKAKEAFRSVVHGDDAAAKAQIDAASAAVAKAAAEKAAVVASLKLPETPAI